MCLFCPLIPGNGINYFQQCLMLPIYKTCPVISGILINFIMFLLIQKGISFMSIPFFKKNSAILLPIFMVLMLPVFLLLMIKKNITRWYNIALKILWSLFLLNLK